jgi:hypothetical protein
MFRWYFHPRARHPLVRLLTAAIGAAALVVLLAFGLVAVAALAAGGALVLLFNALRSPRNPSSTPHASQAPPPADVIEGEFKVVEGPRGQARTQS